MPGIIQVKHSVDILDAVDRLVEEAYSRAGLGNFHRRESVRLSDSVEFARSGQLVPVWNCGPAVNLYGHLRMDVSHIFSLANSLGLFVDLMDEELIGLVRHFICEIEHGDFYHYEDTPDDIDGFYSAALFNERPARISLTTASLLGTFKSQFVYLLVKDEDSRYSSYEYYCVDFFLDRMFDMVHSRVSDETKLARIMDYLVGNSSKLMQWFELVDNEFLKAFEELDRRFDVFVRALYRLE
jgi:hypothetical protein